LSEQTLPLSLTEEEATGAHRVRFALNATDQSTASAAFTGEKIRDCNRIAALLRERVLRLPFDCKIPSAAEFT